MIITLSQNLVYCFDIIWESSYS